MALVRMMVQDLMSIYLSILLLPAYVDSLLGPRGSGLLMLKLLLKQTSPEDVTTAVLNIPGANLSGKNKVHKSHAYVRTVSTVCTLNDCTSQARVPSLEPSRG